MIHEYQVKIASQLYLSHENKLQENYYFEYVCRCLHYTKMSNCFEIGDKMQSVTKRVSNFVITFY